MIRKSRLLILFFILGSLLSLCSCGSSEKEREAQRLNDIAYNLHYRSLDGVKSYADSVLSNPDYSDEAKAEALNNLVFYHIVKMDYGEADSLAHHVYDLTDNHIELLIASVQQMRICQRRSDNKNFYEHRQRALQHLERINEEDRTILSQHQLRRLVYAESELHIVEAAYYYYVGLEKESRAAIDTLDEELILHNDTAQYLAYLYNIGSGGYLSNGTPEDIRQQEFQSLMRCYMLSIQYGYPFWQANAMQALSEHLTADSHGLLISDNQTAISYLNTELVADTLLAGNMAQRAEQMFQDYGDIYQTAASWRTLSGCYFHIADYPGAVYCLQKALSDKKVEQAPSLLASIHEDMSIAFAALGEKVLSDQQRNAYLDLQENTRQDRQLEARAELLDSSLRILNIMVIVIVILLVVLFAVLITLITRRLIRKHKGIDDESAVVQKFRQAHDLRLSDLDTRLTELEEQIAVQTLTLDRQQETYEEHRAKMSLIDSITPLIDRMLHEIKSQEGDKEYVVELAEKINQENNILTEWIQLKQGELALRIETFATGDLFDLLRRSSVTFSSKGISLCVEDSDLSIKADKTLTLFMLNTLCDNARKFTPQGGMVTVDAHEAPEDMVELSVRDTGQGMTEEQCQNIFVAKPITDDTFNSRLSTTQNFQHSTFNSQVSHGFGILNCKGIIEKYKKTSPLFKDCAIGVESKVGEGTRFFFRLPKGIKRLVVLLFCVFSCTLSFAEDTVHSLADSVYQSNISGTYERTMYFADKCVHELNAIRPAKSDSIVIIDNSGATPAEVLWLRDSLNMPYDAILTLRNEVAVAALALHDWNTYNYNNKAYTQLFREMSVDHSLEGYCQKMQQTETDRTVAIMLLVILLLAFVPVFYFLYYRHVISDNRTAIRRMEEEELKRCLEIEDVEAKLKQLKFEADRLYVSNNVMANSLSTIKHETMYYPSRLRQMCNVESVMCNDSEIEDVATYYRSLYDILTEHARYNCRHQLDARLLREMLLRKLARIGDVEKVEDADDVYEVYEVHVTINLKPSALNPQLRLCTQIVRDLGEQYNLRRCGITKEDEKLKITIPNGKV